MIASVASIASMPGSALAGIQAGQERAATAASDIARAHGHDEADAVELSGWRPADLVGASVDLRVARYQVAANVATLRTYDETMAVWRRL